MHAALGTTSRAAPRTPEPAVRRLGVQLYTVRDQMKDPAGTLKAIAGIGYRELEILQPLLDVVAPIARDLGLTMPSLHLDPAIVLDAPAGSGSRELGTLAERAKAHGVQTLVMAWVPFERRPTDAAGWQQLGARLQEAATLASRAGLGFAYHNHAFEFARAGDRRPLDLLLASTDAARVKLELDVFWVAVTGADPVDVMREYRDRIALLHLKDKAKGVGPAQREDQVPPSAFMPVGSGSIDFRAVLAAATDAGVAHLFVEQDHAVGDPIDGLRTSCAYLQSIAG